MRCFMFGAALVATSGCKSFEPAFDGSLFLTQRVGNEMEALFRGTVSLDEAGCYRLGLGNNQITMVWPPGYRLIPTIEGPAVVNQDGNEVGRVGGSFEFAGGVVQTLSAGVVEEDELRSTALIKCPGTFWLASPLR